MPQILPSSAPSPRSVLGWDGTVYRVLALDDEGRLQVDLVGSANPEASGTIYYGAHTMVGAGGWNLDVHTVAPGTVFVLTSMGAYNGTAVTGAIWGGVRRGLVNNWFMYMALPAAAEVVLWTGRIYCVAGDIVRAYFAGAGGGNVLLFSATGYTLVL